MAKFTVKPENASVDHTNLRIAKGEKAPVMAFEPYEDPTTHAHIQIIKGTELEVDVNPIYGDAGKTKKFYRVLHTNQAALNKWTKAPHPTLPRGDLFVYGNDGELVK